MLCRRGLRIPHFHLRTVRTLSVSNGATDTSRKTKKTRHLAPKQHPDLPSKNPFLDQINVLKTSPLRENVQGLLNVCASEKKSGSVTVAIQAYLLATTSLRNLTKSEIDRNTQNLLATFKYCNDIHQLLHLRYLWLNVIPKTAQLPANKVRYFVAFIQVMLNTSQILRAKQLFIDILTLELDLAPRDRLNLMPTTRLLDNMVSYSSCDDVLHILQVIQPIKPMDSTKFLSFALKNSHYRLLAHIYDHDISPKLDKSNVSELFNRETLLQILHTFALHGDVQRTLAMIESYFLHESLQGRKSLTKELSLEIIQAYCYHVPSQTHSDESIMRVLDIISGLNKKLKREGRDLLSYKDISEPMSHRYMNYDPGTSEETVPEEDEFYMEPIGAIHNPRGNAVANLQALSSLISVHLAYIERMGYSSDVAKIFLNSVLNHINLYQSFTGMVRALLAFQRFDPTSFKEFVDHDTIDIILNSLANSNAAKLSSLYLYQFMKAQSTPLTHDNYRCLISASLRGNFHDLLQYYLYCYISDFSGEIDGRVLGLIRNLPLSIVKSNTSTKLAIEYVQKLYRKEITPDGLEEYWNYHKICRSDPSITDENLPGFSRQYNFTVDSRDVTYLKFITRDIVLIG